ncbi:hypothetical protein V1282_005650 [Nitrobacteraceae bacterium AZCC 2146]
MDQNSTGLMAFWSDIDVAYEARYREWHTTEHIPERVAIPGFLTGQRYARVHGGRAFFMFYDTESVSVLGSAAYLNALNAPTPWTLESLKHFRNPLRNLYRKLAERGPLPSEAAQFVTCIRFNRPEVASSYDSEHEFDVMSTGVETRIRLLEVDQAATSQKTKERDVYGVQPRSQRYLYIIDMNVNQSPADAVVLKNRLAAGGLEDIDIEIYQLEFGMVSQSPLSSEQ